MGECCPCLSIQAMKKTSEMTRSTGSRIVQNALTGRSVTTGIRYWAEWELTHRIVFRRSGRSDSHQPRYHPAGSPSS